MIVEEKKYKPKTYESVYAQMLKECMDKNILVKIQAKGTYRGITGHVVDINKKAGIVRIRTNRGSPAILISEIRLVYPYDVDEEGDE